MLYILCTTEQNWANTYYCDQRTPLAYKVVEDIEDDMKALVGSIIDLWKFSHSYLPIFCHGGGDSGEWRSNHVLSCFWASRCRADLSSRPLLSQLALSGKLGFLTKYLHHRTYQYWFRWIWSLFHPMPGRRRIFSHVYHAPFLGLEGRVKLAGAAWQYQVRR